jgi:hypothetical protein
MTVYKITTISKYIGLSTDTMPADVPIGSELFAVDNKCTYVCYDGTNWTSKGDAGTALNTPSASESPSKSPSESPSESPSVSPS